MQFDPIESIAIGTFSDIGNQPIALPGRMQAADLKVYKTHSPGVIEFVSNQITADLLRASVIAQLSASNQYQILKTGGADTEFSGVVPDAAKIGIINAKVKYFEQTLTSSEDYFFTLMATKGGGNFQEQLRLLAAKKTSSELANRSQKGFSVPVPYLEMIAALEVELELIKDSTGQPLIPTQIFRSYYVNKWGGSSDQSHLPEPLKRVIVTQFQKDESIMESLKNQASKLQIAYLEPDEFLAMGGNLKYDSAVPRNSLEIQTRLAQDIAVRFTKLISKHTEEAVLNVASGDKTAVIYINANAYELAINRLENVTRSEADSFNLALAYESIGEYRQAMIYYQEALDKNPGNKIYQDALKRVTR